MKRSRMVGVAMALAAAVVMGSPASAKRSSIDGGGTRILSGYCDYNGDDCSAIQAGFSVDFGNGATSSFHIYGNGLVSFGDALVDYKKTDTFNPFSDTLATFGGNIITPGLFPTTTFNGAPANGPVFATDAVLLSNTSNLLSVLFEYCAGASRCDSQAQVDIRPISSGLSVVFSHYSDFDDSNSPGVFETQGYSINGHAVKTDDRFTIDARIGDPVSPTTGAVPEPATWAMMLVGFGTVGAALRRRRAKAETPALAS